MIRIKYTLAASDGSLAAISPDGNQAAAITWQGDLKRNVNTYSLIVFDLKAVALGNAGPRVILKRDFAGDKNDNRAAPFTSLTFLSDNRTIAFLGRDGSQPEQVYSVNIENGKLRQWTRHPTAVRTFAFGPDGNLRAFSAVADPIGGGHKERLANDGVFMWDREVFPDQLAFSSAFSALSTEPIYLRQFFLVGAGEGSQPKLLFDSRESQPTVKLDFNDARVRISPILGLHHDAALGMGGGMTVGPSGRYLLMYPYALAEHSMEPERYAFYADKNAYERRIAAPAALVDLANGRIERLIDAPSPQFGPEAGPPLWVPDGRSILLYTLLKDKPAAPPQWVEVDISTKQVTPLTLPKGWKPVSWQADGRALIISKGGRSTNNGRFYGKVSRSPGGKWGRIVELGEPNGFNGRFWQPATNGEVVIGIKQSPTASPELALFDLSTKRMTVLTDLNPQLRQRRLGAVETFRWESPHQNDAESFLLKPVDYKPGTRYPLVILLDDGFLGQKEEPYMLDAAEQTSGHAIQMLAAHGFMVLYPRTPRGLPTGSEEGKWMRAQIESAAAALDQAGLIDRNRIGISGFSRAAYHTNYLVMHSTIPFAAATAVDGGQFEYNDGMRPYYDNELRKICTPLMFEAHRLPTLTSVSHIAGRLESFGKAAEILYFAEAPHDLIRPRHRLRSLGTHIDWWRFWLKGEEASDPSKRNQYAHWRQLRETHKRALRSCPNKSSH